MRQRQAADDEPREHKADAKRQRRWNLQNVVPFTASTTELRRAFLDNPFAYSCDACDRLLVLKELPTAKSKHVSCWFKSSLSKTCSFSLRGMQVCLIKV